MIYYFSGTGNSRMVANLLAGLTSDKCISIADSLRASRTEISLADGEKIGFVFPVYSWGVPPIVIRFIKEMRIDTSLKSPYIYFICVCGDETGMAPQQIIRALAKRGLQYSAGYSVIMPNNYVLLPGFDVDAAEVMQGKLDKAPARIGHIAERLMSGAHEIDCHLGPWPRLKYYLVYPLFVRWGIKTSLFRSTDACIGCGKCASVCPVKNITMNGNRPQWGSDCTSCLACYHICPQRVVRYGKATENKGQYYNRQSHC